MHEASHHSHTLPAMSVSSRHASHLPSHEPPTRFSPLFAHDTPPSRSIHAEAMLLLLLYSRVMRPQNAAIAAGRLPPPAPSPRQPLVAFLPHAVKPAYARDGFAAADLLLSSFSSDIGQINIDFRRHATRCQDIRCQNVRCRRHIIARPATDASCAAACTAATRYFA